MEYETFKAASCSCCGGNRLLSFFLVAYFIMSCWLLCVAVCQIPFGGVACACRQASRAESLHRVRGRATLPENPDDGTGEARFCVYVAC